jgi:Flp pilus assembly protein TadD
MSNLANLYGQQGEAERAAGYRLRVDAHRMSNPYYRYRLARIAFVAEDYDTSIEHLKYSVRKKKNEDTFYFLMGLSYLRKGDESAARQWMEKAEQVAEDDDLQRNYHSKLEMLLSPQE